MTMSSASTRFIHVIYIASTAENVFDAITRPEIARTYCPRQRDAAGRAGWRGG